MSVYGSVLYDLFSDHKTPGGPVCSWSSSALLSVVREVDRTAGAACGAGAQGGAAGSKGTLQLLLDSTFSTTNTTSRLYIESLHVPQSFKRVHVCEECPPPTFDSVSGLNEH